ncbi:MAG TPA: Clp protease N-terminal domain-containing protein [Jiangellaceae bacterium]|nr:Clp protease N-terminal domain-containing protein [Jiangellaceae bacterium]
MGSEDLPARLDELIEYTKNQHPEGGVLRHLSDAVLVSEHLGELSDHLVGHFVDQARKAGASWTEIGGAMGVSKQAAQKRFVPRAEDLGADAGLHDRLTDRAKRVAAAAQQEARRSGHAQVGSLHVVLGLTAEPKGLAALAIQAQDVGLDDLRGAVTEVLGTGGGSAPEHVPFGSDAKKVLQLALREALRFGHNYVGTEHILLGLLRDEKSAGAKVLTGCGVTREQSEQWVLAALEGYRRAREQA